MLGCEVGRGDASTEESWAVSRKRSMYLVDFFFLLLYLNFSFNWRTVTLPLLTFFSKIGARRHSSRCNKTDMVRPLCFKYAFTKKKKYAFTTYIMQMPANM